MLYLTPCTVADPLPVDVIVPEENAYGLVSVSDFQVQGTTIGTIDGSAWEAQVTQAIDVTDAVRAVYAEGSPFLAFQLRASEGPNDNGVSNNVTFFAPGSAIPDYAPRLEIAIQPSAALGLRDQAAILEDSRAILPSWGSVYWQADGAAYPAVLRRWIHLPRDSADGDYFYAAGLGWLWTSMSLFPYLYSVERNSWLYPLTEEAAGWFYDFSQQDWFYNLPS